MNKEQLLAKLDEWSAPGRISAYYGHYPTAPGMDRFATEADDTGYLHICSDSITYYNLLDGSISRIRKAWAPKDWLCYTQLHEKAVALGTFNVDIPLHCEIIEHNGAQLEYSELQSPGGSYGENCVDDFFDWKHDSVTYLKEYIDECAATYKACLDVANDNLTGVPKNVCALTNRFRGPEGFFWSDVDLQSWTFLGSEIKDKVMLNVRGVLQFAEAKGYVTVEVAKELVKYARDKWTTA